MPSTSKHALFPQLYVIAGARGSGVICLNGAAARLVHEEDKVIIMAYCHVDSAAIHGYSPTVVFVN